MAYQLELKNIGLIQEANIEVGGLTVIAGKNDVGKSFVGKTLFAVIKTMNEAEKEFWEDKSKFIYNELVSIFRFLEPLTPQNISLETTRKKLNRTRFILDQSGISVIYSIIKTLENELESIKSPELFSSLDNKTIENIDRRVTRLNSLEKYLTETPEKSDLFLRDFDQKIQSIFQSQICTFEANESNILLRNGLPDNVFFQANFNRNLLEIIDVKDQICHLHDVTYLDSPYVLQISRFIRNRFAFADRRESEILGAYEILKDTVKKLTISIPSTIDQPIFSNLYEKIRNTIEGSVFYDLEDDDFIYEKSSGFRVQKQNIASGIKAFGMLQMLLNAGYISSDSLLVIDEPETNLHPEWQVQYAHVIAILAKEGVPIVINSHSPYFIEAIKHYSDKEEIGDRTKFYYGEIHKGDNGSRFQDVTENLGPIYRAFSYPMQRLIFEK